MIKKLELGCGKNPLSGYLHQDITTQDGVELDFICLPWEIELPENSLTEVIALAMMEHLRFEDFKKTAKHIFNLLEPGGAFLFDVPDMKIWSEYLYNLTHNKQDLNPFPEYHIWATIYGWQRWPGDEHKSGWVK
jgi:predicted SAM-dependent methyltransferase